MQVYQRKLVHVKQWQTLEDLALTKQSEEDLSFRFVLQDVGREAVEARKEFLEVNQRKAGTNDTPMTVV